MKTRLIFLFLVLYLGVTIPAVAQDNTNQPQSVTDKVKSTIPNMKPNPLITEGYLNNDAIKDTVLLVRYDKADYYDKTDIREVKKILIVSNDKEGKNKPYYYPYPLWAATPEWYSEPNRTESIWIKNTTLYLQEKVNYDSGTYTTVYQFKIDGYSLVLSGMECTVKNNTGKSDNIKISLGSNKIRFDEFNPDSIYRIAGFKSSLIGDYTTHAKDFHTLYTGRIADKYNIMMYLEKNGKKITGYYRYTGQESPLILNGTIESPGKVTIKESLNRGPYMETTGIFSGKITGTNITGEWHTPDNSKKMSFEVNQPSKKSVLQHTIGTYYLSSIQGWWGASTMFDSTKDTNGAWSSHVSALSAGMREGWDVTHSAEDIKLLNSMNIQVDTDLTVRFFAGGKLLLEVPFNETGMKYSIDLGRDDPYRYLSSEKLSSSTTFIDDKLYLTATDDTDYSDTIPASDYIMANKGPVSLTYFPLNDSFSLSIGYGSDSNILSFTRK